MFETPERMLVGRLCIMSALQPDQRMVAMIKRTPTSGSRVSTFILLLAICVTILPAAAFGQAVTGAIGGTVKDASGAVLPGVTVEVSSPALIERVRTAVSDGQGVYKV